MDEFRFTIPGPPKPWSRARRDGRTGRTFTDPKTAVAKADVTIIGGAAMRARGVKAAKSGTPVLIDIEARFKIPPSITKKDRERRLRRRYHTIKPDGDNIAKLIKDALSGVVWADDCQVQIKRCVKMWDINESGTTVHIEILRED